MSLAAEPALADSAPPEPGVAAEVSVPDLLDGGPLGSTVESTLAGLLPTGADGGDPPETNPPEADPPEADPSATGQSETDPPDQSPAPVPGPLPSESDEGQPALPAPDPVRQPIEPSAPPEVEESLAVVEELAPRAAEAVGELAEPLGEKVDAVSIMVTRLSCDELAERDLPELCLPELAQPGLGLPGLGLPDLGLPGLGLPEVALPEPELPGAGQAEPGQGPAPTEPQAVVIDERAVMTAGVAPVVVAPSLATGSRAGDLADGPPAVAVPSPVAFTALPPLSDAPPVAALVAATSSLAEEGRHGLTIRRWPAHPDATLGSGGGDAGGVSACCGPAPETPVLRSGGADSAGGLTASTRVESVPALPG